MQRLHYIGLAMLIFLMAMWLTPTAMAWQNGQAAKGLGRLTVQQWILRQAVAEAAQSGSDWVDLDAALKTVGLPDTYLHDYRYHVYDRWGGRRTGDAARRTAAYFGLLHDALQAGDTSTASQLLGLLTHYYTDASDPLHTDQSRGERRVHRWFERSVMRQMNRSSGLRRSVERRLSARFAAMASGEGREAYLVAVGDDVKSFTATSADTAHHSYRRLLRKLHGRHFGKAVARITAKTLERSVKGIVDLIGAAESDAVVTYATSTESTAAPALMSQNRVVSASSQDTLYHAARFGNDGDSHSSWKAGAATYPQWWQVDLGTARDLQSVKINWYQGKTRSYDYIIQVSDDGTSWATASDKSTRTTFGTSADSVIGAHGRYLRVTVLGYGTRSKARGDAASSAPAAISEISVYGAGDSTPTPTPKPTATQTSTPTPTPKPTATQTPTPPPTPTPTATPAPTATASTIAVPSGATKAQIDQCVAKAVAAGKGTRLEFPAGYFAYSGTFTVPDGINVRGQGIWNQAATDGDGGTWLACTRGMRWGSDSTIENLLVGQNTAGVVCQYRPVARGTATAGADTQTNGSHKVTFSFVRFKGGSDAGASLIELGSNFNSLWTGTLKTIDMVDTTWNDCEFERPQSTNTVNGTSLGAVMNIWWDSRKGGAQVHGLAWNRCHFGVKNGYNTGVDGYGIGRTILFQPAPAEHATDGPRPNSGGVGDGTNGWNPSFDWNQVDHGSYGISFTDSLFEYANWYPVDACDYSRSYSVWKGNWSGLPGTSTTALSPAANSAYGWGNPPGSRWSEIPAAMWLDNFDVTRSYFKGSWPTGHGVVHEIGRNSAARDSYCGTGSTGGFSGKYGNVVTGSFTNGMRPATAIFNVDWSGATTSYTPSPYDP